MEAKNILNITKREDFRKWLIENHNKESECWMINKYTKRLWLEPSYNHQVVGGVNQSTVSPISIAQTDLGEGL